MFLKPGTASSLQTATETRLTGYALILFLVGIASVLAGSVSFAQSESTDDRTIQRMCRSGLAEAAVRYAQAELRIANTTRGTQSEHASLWTMRLMECYAQAAMRDIQKAPDYWNLCDQTYADALASDIDPARAPWLAWQIARCNLLQSQTNLAEHLAVPANQAARQRALELVRNIITQMDDLENDVRRRQPLAARQSTTGGTEAPAEQLAKLAVDAGLMRCEALLIRSRLYEADSQDRIAAAANVELQSAEILKRTGPDWPSRGPLRVAQAAAWLDLGKSSEALMALTELAQEYRGSNTGARAAMSAIEYLASHGATSRARALLPLLETSDAGAELAIAGIQLALADLERAPEDSREAILANLIEQSKAIGDNYGGYWRFRAEALLTGSDAVSSASGESGVAIDLMKAEVRQLLAAGDATAAIERLLVFRDNEAAAARGSSAIQLAEQASALLMREEQWLAAADAIEQTAIQFRTAPESASAHLRAIVSISQALRSDFENAEIVNRYETALHEQLQHWPDSEQTSEPQEWLSRWLNGKGRRAEFADIVLDRAARCENPQVAREALELWCSETLRMADTALVAEQLKLMQVRIDQKQFDSLRPTAKAVLLLATAFSDWPDRNSAKRIEQASNELRASIQDDVDRYFLLAVDLVNAARLGQLPTAVRLSTEWKQAALAIELDNQLTRAFVAAVTEQPRDSQPRWAEVLKLDRGRAQLLLEDTDVMLKACGYRILVWNGEISAALAGLSELVKQQPKNGSLRLELANALADSGDPRIADSMKIARSIAASSQPGSELNLAARWRMLKNQLRLGEKEQARKSAQLLLAAQPISNAIWQARFESVANSTQ